MLNKNSSTTITFINLDTAETTEVQYFNNSNLHELYRKMHAQNMVPMDWHFSTLPGAVGLMCKFAKLGFLITDFLDENSFLFTTNGFMINYSYHRMPSVMHKGIDDFNRLYNAVHAMNDDKACHELLNKLTFMYYHFDILIKPNDPMSATDGIELMKEYYEKLLPYLEEEMAKK